MLIGCGMLLLLRLLWRWTLLRLLRLLLLLLLLFLLWLRLVLL